MECKGRKLTRKVRIDNDMKGDTVKKYWKRIMVGVTFLIISWIALKPEYRVVFQLRSSGRDYTETMVCVVVKHVWLKKQLDKTVDEVVREHRRINYDTPTNEITLIFYRSMKDFDNGIGWKQYVYRVDGNEVELIAEDIWP